MSVTLTSSPAGLESLNRVFREFAELHGLSTPVRNALSLAIEEVIVNVITHGYRGQDGQPIAVEIRVDSAKVVMTVEDSAPVFNPLEAPPPDLTTPLEKRRPGGLGVHLTRKVMDGLHYSRIHGKNRLVLTKSLSARTE